MTRRFGGAARVEDVEVATLGGSNRTLLFNLVEGAATRRLVFRQETYRLGHSPFIAPSAQFRLLKIAYASEIPVPEPVFEFEPADQLGRGYVVAYVPGETLPRRLITDPRFSTARARFAEQAGALVGRLHRIEPAQAAFLAETPDSLDPIAAQLARLDYYGEAHPAVELAVRWLRMQPRPTARRCLLHGDFRNGNLMMGEEGIRALLDWECAHLGDPMEEFGWLCLRSWRFGELDKPVGGLCERAPFYAAYTAASGIEIDPDAVRWWEIFGFVRWIVLNIMQVHGHSTGVRRSPAFAACGRNTCLIEYDLLMTLLGHYQ
ncbi:MAG: phosphotransferase family protein [Gammaproteobacteria bacterium]|nr:phosphotransferase family protein [Gammaproteobacteria bacterium]